MPKHHRYRRGLSTLELVLALPILLFIMALMINFGTVACWKVRALNVARDSLWSSRWPRLSVASPRPNFWPATAGAGGGDAGNLPALDDPRVNQPVARGPLTGAVVNTNLLDPTRGLREGSATLDRRFTMLAKLGIYHLRAGTEALDNRWQYGQMGLLTNMERRIPVIYALQKASENLVTAYVQAVVAIYYAPFRQALSPLDRDDEFIFYGQLFHWSSGAPDFHPYLIQFCSLDRALADERVTELIDRIQGKKKQPRVPDVAENMTRAFIGLYERAIQAYKDLINATPPPPPAQAADMQSKIDQLQKKIDTLNEFLQTLQ